MSHKTYDEDKNPKSHISKNKYRSKDRQIPRRAQNNKKTMKRRILRFLELLDIFFTRIMNIIICISFITPFIIAKVTKRIEDLVTISKSNIILLYILSIILIFSAIIMVAYILNKYVLRHYKIKQVKLNGKIFLVILLAIIIIIVTTYTSYNYMQPLIKITSPEDNALINKTIDINGTAKRIPEGDSIWAVVYAYDPTNRYYPQSQLIYPDPDGLWRLKDITVGVDKDHGRKFDIIVVSADDKADKIFRDSLKPPWEGLEKISSGIKEYDRITVTRA